MGTHTGGIGRGPRADSTGPGGRRAGRPDPIQRSAATAARLTSRAEAEPLLLAETDGAAVEPPATPGPRFKFRKTTGIGAPSPLPPLRPAPASDLAAALPSIPEAPAWSPLVVAAPLFVTAWICFVALAATVTTPAEADVAGLGHVLAMGAVVVALVLVTLSVAHIQVSGLRPRPAACGVVALGLGQGLVAAALGSGSSDLWGVGGQLFVLIGFTVPLAWVGGQFQSGVQRQRVERHASLIASWIERARHQASQTVDSVHRHDVRSMLFVIDGAARALTDTAQPLTDDQRAGFAAMLTESVARLGSLTDVRSAEIQPFAVADLARAVVHAERKAGRPVTATLAEGLTALGRAADAAAVLRTLVHITARDHAGVRVASAAEGGAIVVRVEPADAADLPLLTNCWEEVWAGSFKFSSTDDDTTIDLYVAARLLGEQGADLWATAERDRFAVRLPFAPDSGVQEEV